MGGDSPKRDFRVVENIKVSGGVPVTLIKHFGDNKIERKIEEI